MIRLARISGLICLLAASLAHGQGQTKELHWQSLDVRAHLDADGALHVRETQGIVFNGDWNGGERRFSIRDGQRLKFERLIEKDASGNTLREFDRGDLDDIGEFRWFDGDMLRWRTHLPDDPPFRDELRIYELDYVIAGVLVRRGGRFFLDHDFAFPDRTGNIERLHGELTFDPSWRATDATDTSFDVDWLPPGQGAVRSATLEYVGTGHPLANGEIRAAPLGRRSGVHLARRHVARRRCRRHTPGTRTRPLRAARPPRFDRRRLARGALLRYRPEDVGAAWDGDISTHEVMAILARMSQARQISERSEAARLVDLQEPGSAPAAARHQGFPARDRTSLDREAVFRR